MEILSVKDLKFKYPSADNYAVADISFGVQRGEIVVLCGVSGCGKTTLLRLLKREIAPFGTQNGTICFEGTEVSRLDSAVTASHIGFVMQEPDTQIVTDAVWHELAFGLENMGINQSEIRRRVGEMASYFGIQGWFMQSTDSLSGGQKQLLNLASTMVMQPSLLLLDEPTSRLDPIAADEFITTIQKLNSDFGLTVIIAEHRLDAILPIASRVLLMHEGRLIVDSKPCDMLSKLLAVDGRHPMLKAMPAPVKICSSLFEDEKCVLTVKECKDVLQKHYPDKHFTVGTGEHRHFDKKAIEVNNVWFRYQKHSPDVLRGISLDVCQGESVCILGGNGVGKSTLVSVIAGMTKPTMGKVSIKDKLKLALLPQEPKALFLKDQVMADLSDAALSITGSRDAAEQRISAVVSRLGIESVMQKHPYDLSGGEMQKCAIAKILLSSPDILLLDEPTKGLDADAKQTLGDILKSLKADGITMLIVTHDLDFAAEYADRCALLFDGVITSDGDPCEFFAKNAFYTTSASRIARDIADGAVTVESVISTLGGRMIE